jgi:Protein of unknown function (DUF2894)
MDPSARTPAAVEDAQPLLAALRKRGLHRSDPARFRYLEVLAARAARAQGTLRQLLDARLAGAVAAYEVQADQALARATTLAAPWAARQPEAAAALQRLQAESDAPALRALAARWQARGPVPGPLSALVGRMDGPGSATALPGAAPGELKALRQSRGTWARLRVAQQLSRSLATVPDNPGPLNSHLLVLRALRLMQALSPGYLERFVVHAEALLWLDQAQVAAAPARASGRAGARPAARPPR